MSFTRESSTQRAKSDLAKRLSISEADVAETGIEDREFPDMTLGAAVDGEMAAQMISSGWVINLQAGGKAYEYRADKYQIRLRKFNGKNYVIES
jgi:hypothetical protein